MSNHLKGFNHEYMTSTKGPPTTNALTENGGPAPAGFNQIITTSEGPRETTQNFPGSGAPINLPPMPYGMPCDPLLKDPAPGLASAPITPNSSIVRFKPETEPMFIIKTSKNRWWALLFFVVLFMFAGYFGYK